MLTADLVRATVRSGVVRAQYVDPDDADLIARAAQLVALFADSVGQPRAELDDALDDLASDDPRPIVLRGLAKLLDDRSEWSAVAPLDPGDLRRRVFEAAAASHPVGTRRSAVHPVCRQDVLVQVASELGVEPQTVERALYADLREEHVLQTFDPLQPDELLHRYNLGIAQGVLLRARELRIDVKVRKPAQLRWIYRQLKFHQLMHRSTALPDGSWRLTIDGPASVLGGGQRYGLQMALLLPSVLRLDHWELEADVDWPEHGTVAFRLTPKQGLRATVRETGTWVSAEEKLLVERLRTAKTTWRVEPTAEVIELAGQDVLVPDLVMVCGATGRRVWVEIVGYWRRDWLVRRLELLAAHAPGNLVLCVSKRLKLDRDELGAAFSGVVEFGEVIPVPKLLAALEAVSAAQ